MQSFEEHELFFLSCREFSDSEAGRLGLVDAKDVMHLVLKLSTNCIMPAPHALSKKTYIYLC